MNADDRKTIGTARVLIEFNDQELTKLAAAIDDDLTRAPQYRKGTEVFIRHFINTHGVAKKDYSYKITKGLIDILIVAAAHVKEHQNQYFEIGELGLANYQYTQFTKLRLHALIAKRRGPDGKFTGEWVITRRGWGFLSGKELIQESVTSHENKVKERFGPMVGIGDVLGDGFKPYLERIDDFTFEEFMFEKGAPRVHLENLEIER